jgi:hypothetical protein
MISMRWKTRANSTDCLPHDDPLSFCSQITHLKEMIKYALQCEKGHGFESWFDSGSAYDKLARRGFVECPHCGSGRVEKQIMSPSVRLSSAQSEAVEPATDAPSTGAGTASGMPETVPMAAPAVPAELPVTLMSEKAQELREMIRSFHAHIEANTEDVGAKFADEARKIHYGETEERAIRGKATVDEAEELRAEGIGFLPLPPLPDQRN